MLSGDEDMIKSVTFLSYYAISEEDMVTEKKII